MAKEALELLAKAIADFDFIQFIDEIACPMYAWSSVSLLFSRGMFLDGMFPIIPSIVLSTANNDDTIITMMNTHYEST
jgi:hypothetical protein